MNTSHYPSLELCKKLTEIGFPKTYYTVNEPRGNFEISYGFFIKSTQYYYPSVMEMLDVMPREIMKNGFGRGYLSIQATDISYSVAFLFDGVPRGEYFARDTLPNALAEMILWLVENKYLTFNNEKS